MTLPVFLYNGPLACRLVATSLRTFERYNWRPCQDFDLWWMSLRELRGSTLEGEPEAVLTRLRSGGKRMEPSAESDSSMREGSAEEGEIQELLQKLSMATEEHETVRADLTMQLHQTRQMAEATKEEKRGARARSTRRTIAELEETVDRQKKEWMEELEAVRMRMELEKIRQLEEVRRQLEEVW